MTEARWESNVVLESKAEVKKQVRDLSVNLGVLLKWN
jgi:hypothetical protein